MTIENTQSPWPVAVVHLLVEGAAVMLVIVRKLLFRKTAKNHGLLNSECRMFPEALHGLVDPNVGRGTLRRHVGRLLQKIPDLYRPV